MYVFSNLAAKHHRYVIAVELGVGEAWVGRGGGVVVSHSLTLYQTAMLRKGAGT